MASVPALNVLAVFLSDLSYAIIVGILLARSWLPWATPKQVGENIAITIRRLYRLQSMCLAVLLTCHFLRPWFAASSMSGSTQFETTLSLVPTILSATRQGALWYANSAALAMLIAAHCFLGKRSAPVTGTIEITALCVLAATKAASSHASEEGDFTSAEISQFLHLLATSVWAGAIVVSGFLVAPRLVTADGAVELWNYGTRLSKTVTWALGVLVLSGLYTSWRDMHGTINVLWISSWGKLLLTKGTFVVVAVALGSVSRFNVWRVPRPLSSQLP